jgi:hypothetical protein
MGMLAALAAGAAVSVSGKASPGAKVVQVSGTDDPKFITRGVVITPADLTLRDWPERAKKAGLTTIGLHHGASPSVVRQYIASDTGREFLANCRKLGLQVEYELHAMRELLPRDLFDTDPDLFRMNDKGERTPDTNLCVHSDRALEIASQNAVALGRAMRPTTSRYFLWGDDGAPWCRCPNCAPLSDSDQALIVENRLLSALRRDDTKAQVAHLCYENTFSPPKEIKPDAGVFLEFAPLSLYGGKHTKDEKDLARALAILDANLRIFPRDTAQILEYWLDVSAWSHWTKPAVELRIDKEALARDLDAYAARGIRHITTFAVYIDAEYVAQYGDRPLYGYSAALMANRESVGPSG